MRKKKTVSKRKPAPKIVFFDESRAYKVFSAIQKAWENKEGVFSDVVLPEGRCDNLPKEPREQANFLFFASITMRGSTVSDDPVRWLNRLAMVHPGIFDPIEIMRVWDEEKICELFSSVTKELLTEKGLAVGSGHMGPKYREFAKSWIHNARVIGEKWGGNILNVYSDVDEFEESFAKVDYRKVGKPSGLKGIRRKIFSLFTIWLQTYDLIPKFPTPLPVDFHALRIILGTNVARISTLKPLVPSKRPKMKVWSGRPCFRVSEKITDEIALWSQEFILMNGFDHMAINPAIWVLSRTLCADHFQNSCLDRVVPKAPLPEDFKIHHWPKGYRDPCQFCPVRKLCHQVAPSGPYYRWGFVIPIKRVHCLLPKQDFLPGLERGFTGRMKSKKDV